MDEAMKEIEKLARSYRAMEHPAAQEHALAALLSAVRRLASPPSADGRGLREALRRAAQSMLDATDVEWFGVFTGVVEMTAAQGERITNARAALRAALASPPAPTMED